MATASRSLTFSCEIIPRFPYSLSVKSIVGAILLCGVYDGARLQTVMLAGAVSVSGEFTSGNGEFSFEPELVRRSLVCRKRANYASGDPLSHDISGASNCADFGSETGRTSLLECASGKVAVAGRTGLPSGGDDSSLFLLNFPALSVCPNV
jgi:hypothetical protein